MKLNKTLMAAALMASGLFAGMPIQAQDASNAPATTLPPMHRPAGINLDRLSKQLDLTDDQKTQIKPILEDLQKQRAALRADTTLSPTDKRAKMKEIMDGVSTQVQGILTPDQYAKWQKMVQGNHRPPAAAPSTAAPTTPTAPPAN